MHQDSRRSDLRKIASFFRDPEELFYFRSLIADNKRKKNHHSEAEHRKEKADCNRRQQEKEK